MTRSPRRHPLARLPRAGFTLIEVLVALAILTAGLLTVAATFPYVVKSQREAELLTTAAALAQMKAEEIRRDDTAPFGEGELITAISELTSPTQPIQFPNEPRLTYSFSNSTIQYAEFEATGDPRALPVPRIIVRYHPDFRSGEEVVYELRFK